MSFPNTRSAQNAMYASLDTAGDRSLSKGRQPKASRFVVYVGNLITNDLADEEIEDLIKKSAQASAKSDPGQVEPCRRTIEILSILVFQNCLYIELEDETSAKAIAQSLNNQPFKSSKIQAYCLDKLERESDLFTRNRKDVNQFLAKNDPARAYSKQASLSPGVDCELVVSSRQLRKYADSIHEKLRTSLFGLNARVSYMNGETFDDDLDSSFVKEKLEEALSRKLLYLIFINSTNEQFNSMTLYVTNHWQEKGNRVRGSEVVIKENKNMPLNRALDFLKSDYHNYISHLKKNATNRADDNVDSDAESASEESDDETKDKRNVKGPALSKIFKFNKKQKKFLKLLLKPIINDKEPNASIKLNDMDRLLTYLSKQKTNLITATLASKTEEPVQTTEKAVSQNQPVPLLSMQINPADVSTYSQVHAQIPSLLSMPYQMPPPLLNQAAGLPPSLLQANLMHQFQLIPNYGLGLAGPGPGGMSLLGQYPSVNLGSMTTAVPPPPNNMSNAPPSLMSIQPNQTNTAAPTAPSLMNVQPPSSLMNISLPSYLNGANNSSLLGNPPQGAAYPNKTNSSNPGSANFKQQR